MSAEFGPMHAKLLRSNPNSVDFGRLWAMDSPEQVSNSADDATNLANCGPRLVDLGHIWASLGWPVHGIAPGVA